MNDASFDDRSLLAAYVTQRSEDAFSAIVRRHMPMVRGVCRRVLGDAADAEDAVQATFLALATKAAALRVDETLASWLYVAAVAAARAHARAASRRVRHEPAAAR